MDRTVAHLNIEHYKRLLARETDESRRRVLLRLLAEDREQARRSQAAGTQAAAALA